MRSRAYERSLQAKLEEKKSPCGLFFCLEALSVKSRSVWIMVRSTNGSERPRQSVLSTALAMTEAAHLEARRRTYRTLIDVWNPDRGSALSVGYTNTEADT